MVDPLSDVLRAVRLDGAHFYPVEGAGAWCIEIPAARQLSPRIMPSAEHLISYHSVIEGSCCGGLVGDEPIELGPGDVIVFPHGDANVIASGRDLVLTPTLLGATPSRYPSVAVLGDRGPGAASLICGFLGCDLRPFNPLLASLPRVLHIRGTSSGWHSSFPRQAAEECRLGRPGVECVLARMAELMFIEVLRRHLEALPPGQAGWLAGLGDEIVGPALALLHAQPGQPWTLPDLARKVGTSRSKLAQRFTFLLGQPPMQYLAQWRMQAATRLLLEVGAKVASVGRDVGYDSEAAFSRAFKKATGLAPAAWRDARHRCSEPV